MQIKDKVYGVYNQWIDHPHNYFVQHNYSGKIVEIKDETVSQNKK